jgi:hypothetical protein
MYSQFYNAITAAAGQYIDSQLQYFETTFAPVPPPKSDEWLLILINLLGLGISAIAAPFFEGGESRCGVSSLLPLDKDFKPSHLHMLITHSFAKSTSSYRPRRSGYRNRQRYHLCRPRFRSLNCYRCNPCSRFTVSAIIAFRQITESEGGCVAAVHAFLLGRY